MVPARQGASLRENHPTNLRIAVGVAIIAVAIGISRGIAGNVQW
jgi:hypothetical protein